MIIGLQLGSIILLQVLALIFGALGFVRYQVAPYPSLAMLVWGGGTTAVMLMLFLIGKLDLLNQHGVRGSIFAMICINIFFILYGFANK